MDFDFLSNLGFWASIVFAYLIPKLTPHVDHILAKVWNVVTEQFPRTIRNQVRNRRAKRLRIIRMKRWQLAYINYDISRANAWFIAFIGVIAVYILLLVLGPFKGIFKDNLLAGMILTCPIYIVELIWLYQDSKVKQLLKYRAKIRITSW